MSKIKDLPLLERPREKAMHFGIESLTDVELLAMIIGSGYKGSSALEIASSLLSRSGSLNNLFKMPYQFIGEYKGLKKAISLKLCACFELNKRFLKRNPLLSYLPISSSFDLFQRYAPVFIGLQQEVLFLVVVDSNGQVKNESIVFRGSDDKLLVSFVEILRKIILENGRYFYLIHNHPNNSKQPSKVDRIFTKQLNEECLKLGLKMLDHIIVYDEGYYSMNNDL